MRWMIAGTQVTTSPTDEQIQEAIGHRSDATPVWIDLDRPDEPARIAVHTSLGTPTLALASPDVHHQRPGIETIGEIVVMTLSTPGLSKKGTLHLTPLQVYLTDDLVVTVHHDDLPSLAAVRAQLSAHGGEHEGPLGYAVLDAFVDAGFDALQSFDKAIDELQDRIVNNPDPTVLRELYRLKREVSDLHLMLGAQVDAFQRLLIVLLQFRRSDTVTTAFRSIYDHAVRQYEMADSLRDLITGAMDVYLSTVSNRLDTTMAQLTIVASLFLPLTFLTGFFGMNFSFLVSLLSGPGAFAVGMLIMAASVALMFFVFHRRRWV